MNIYGIPCHLSNPSIRKAIRDVLRRIRARCPKDLNDCDGLFKAFFPAMMQWKVTWVFGFSTP